MSLKNGDYPTPVLQPLSASEVGEFGGYCPQAWWLRCHGAVGAAFGPVRREHGMALHRELGRRTDVLLELEGGSHVARGFAVALIVIVVLLLILALVARAPLARAAGVDSTDLETGASMAAGLPATEGLPLAALVGLLAIGVCALALSLWLSRRGRRLRQIVGLGGPLERGRLVAADDSRIRPLTLWSERLGLAARPDHLIQLADGAVIPVEQKPCARRLYRSHVLQLGAQLLAVEGSFGQRPPYGLVALADGVQHRIPFDPPLEHAVMRTMQAMRACIRSNRAPGRRWLGARCRACEFYVTCWPITIDQLDMLQ